MIILVGNEKGGTGKTTICTNLAAKAATEGKDCLLVDSDKQGSADSWGVLRDERGDVTRVPVVQKFGSGLGKELEDLEKKYDYIFIDIDGRDSGQLRVAMMKANIMVIPIQPGHFDVWSFGKMRSLVEEARGINSGLRAVAVINRASSNPMVSDAVELVEALEGVEEVEVAPTALKDRVAYKKAAGKGLWVGELDVPDHKATGEIDNLYKEIFNGEEKQVLNKSAV